MLGKHFSGRLKYGPVLSPMVLGSNDPNTIPGPARIRCSRFRIVSYVSAQTPLCLDLATFYVSSDSVLSGYVLS